jgi:predicted HNH restriction endonuclease
VCGFNFGAAYGGSAEGYIHVHHLKPLASIGEEYVIDPIKDLRPVCANCHAVIHLRQPPYSIEEVNVMLNGDKNA